MANLDQLAEQIRSTLYLTEHNPLATAREKELAALLRMCLGVIETPHGTDSRLMSAIADVLQSIAPAILSPQGREFRTTDPQRFARGIRALQAIVPIEHVEARSGPADIDAPNTIL